MCSHTPTWLLDKNILNKIRATQLATKRVQSIQTSTLNNLLDGSRLYRMILSANRFGAANVYQFDELMEDTKKAVWSEVAGRKVVDVYRRNLQKAYVEKLLSLLNGGTQTINFGGQMVTIGTDTKNTDVSSYARGQLKVLQSELNAAIPAIADKMTKYHYQDVVERIKQALNPR
jgi:hypothetical protein